MGRRPRNPFEKAWAREEALKPSPYLGYDRHALAVHLLQKGAFRAAEEELRRVVELNPFEPSFMGNLAYCLYRRNRVSEAQTWIRRALKTDPKNARLLEMAGYIVGTRGQARAHPPEPLRARESGRTPPPRG